MIIMGKLLSETGGYDDESLDKTLKKVISARHADMLEVNLKALKIGRDS